jgi:hypothetical protein
MKLNYSIVGLQKRLNAILVSCYILTTYSMSDVSRLSGKMVSLLVIIPKGRGFKPGRGDGFLRAIKIRSTPSFGGEVKPDFVVRFYGILNHFQV